MRFAKGLALALLVALVLWIAGAAWMRSRGPDPLQAQALATLEVPTPPLPPGANAADAMRLLKHDVPVERRAGLLVALREFEEADAKRAQRGGKEAVADPRDAFPARPAVEDALGRSGARRAQVGRRAAACDRGEGFGGFHRRRLSCR